MQNKNLLLLASFTALFLFASCSSVPKAREYKTFGSTTSDAHDEARDWQDSKLGGEYANTKQILDLMDSQFDASDCYTVSSNSVGWGLLEPEVVFLGTSVFEPNGKAVIIVPGLLAKKKDYETPADQGQTKIFRIDQDAPFGLKAAAQLQAMVGNNDQCVKFHRVEEKGNDAFGSVLAMRFYVKNEAKAPAKKTQAPKIEEPKKEEVKPVEESKKEEPAAKPAAEEPKKEEAAKKPAAPKKP